MYEYEFRLVAACVDPFGPFLQDVFSGICQETPLDYSVYYIKPHFRMKHGVLEWKTILSHVTLYHDGLWFKLVESQEIAFQHWSKSITLKFLQNAGHFANPIAIEHRRQFFSDDSVVVYSFERNEERGLVFELEMGVFQHRQVNSFQNTPCISELFNLLKPHKAIYDLFKQFSPFVSHRSSLSPCIRKSVIPLSWSDVDTKFQSPSIWTAPKYDGIFGFVYSFEDHIQEIWENNKRRYRPGVTLTGTGNGLFVFGAEKMPNGDIILLDVYQVRKSRVRCTQSLLTEFLPAIQHPRYKIQKYHHDPIWFYNQQRKNKKNTDGFIFHDVESDTIYKLKTKHTIDLVHFNGFFQLPNNRRILAPPQLENGAVYECSIDDFKKSLRPIRKRTDRFIGNTVQQIENIISASSSGHFLLP